MKNAEDIVYGRLSLGKNGQDRRPQESGRNLGRELQCCPFERWAGVLNRMSASIAVSTCRTCEGGLSACLQHVHFWNVNSYIDDGREIIVEFDIKDIALAEEGKVAVEWANQSMPVLNSIKERFEDEKPLKGVRLGACLRRQVLWKPSRRVVPRSRCVPRIH